MASLVTCPQSFAPTVADAGFHVAPFDDAPVDEWRAVMQRLPGLPPDEANRIVVGEVFGRIDTSAALPGLASTMQQRRPDLVLRDPSEFASWLLAARDGVPNVRVSIGLLSFEARWAGRRRGAQRCSGSAGIDRRPPCAPQRGHPRRRAGDVRPAPRRRSRGASLSGTAPVPMGRPTSCRWATHRWCTSPSVRWQPRSGPGRRSTEPCSPGSSGLEVRVLVTTGAAVDPADLGPLPAHVRVARFVPQDAVLRGTAVMVAHGGFGTVLGALQAGAPMALAPLFADQSYNAARVAEVGAGRVLPTSLDPGVALPELPDAVRAAVLQLLEDAAARAASRALTEEMTTHVPVTSLVEVLEVVAARGV